MLESLFNKVAGTLLKREETPTEMFSYKIYEVFKNYFEEHLRTTVSSSSSFKLDLVDLIVFPDLNLRLAKIKSFTTVCISSKFSRFCSHAFSFLCYQVRK